MRKFVRYDNIKHEHNGEGKVPYELLLSTIEWREFRENILIRDNYICQNCNQKQTEKLHPDDTKYFRKPTQEEIDERSIPIFVDWGNGEFFPMKRAPVVGIPVENPIILHVHHLYYIYDNLPWEYKFDALITVCHSCHHSIHMNQIIPIYSDNKMVKRLDLQPCPKCFGTGFLQQYQHFHEGICFSCIGQKYI